MHFSIGFTKTNYCRVSDESEQSFPEMVISCNACLSIREEILTKLTTVILKMTNLMYRRHARSIYNAIARICLEGEPVCHSHYRTTSIESWRYWRDKCDQDLCSPSVRRLATRSLEILKLRDMYLEVLNRYEIWQTHAETPVKFQSQTIVLDTQSHGFKTSQKSLQAHLNLLKPLHELKKKIFFPVFADLFVPIEFHLSVFLKVSCMVGQY